MKITVITICFNCVDEIEATILSVINQTYDDIEYIIVDGGSTDGTLDIINKYAPKITKIISEPDKGIYDAMNKGVNISTGEWINFMNAGDIFCTKESIKDFFDIADVTTGNDILYGDAILIYPFGKYYKDCHPDDNYRPWEHQSMFIRTSIMKKYKYDLSYKIRADYDFIYKAMNNGSKFVYFPAPIACYKAYDGASTTNDDLIVEETYRIECRRKDWKYWWFKFNFLRSRKLRIYKFWKDPQKRLMDMLEKNPRLTKI